MVIRVKDQVYLGHILDKQTKCGRMDACGERKIMIEQVMKLVIKTIERSDNELEQERCHLPLVRKVFSVHE